MLAAEGIEAKRSDAWRLSSGSGAESQKKTAHAAEQERPDVAAARATWRNEQPGLIAERLVFLDETWARTNMARRYGRGTARRTGGGGHSPWPLEDNHVHCRPASRPDHRALRFDGPINGASFLAWVQQALVPTLSAGDIVIRDNLSSHKSPAYTRPLRRSAQPALPAALQPRSQSHRTGLRQAQSHSPQGRRQNRR